MCCVHHLKPDGVSTMAEDTPFELIYQQSYTALSSYIYIWPFQGNLLFPVSRPHTTACDNST